LKDGALPPLSPLLLICSTAKTRPAQQRTRHRSAPAHTPTCRTEMLANTPPELAGACAAAPTQRPRRPAGQRLSLHLGDLGSPGVPISHRGGRAAPGAGALCPPSGSWQGRALEGLMEPRRSSTGHPYKIQLLMSVHDGECTQTMCILLSRGIAGIDERTRGITHRYC
jgi:hypothetical protein